MTELRSSAPFRVGDFQVEPLRHCLILDAEERRVTHKTMELLLELASRPGAVFTRDQLLASVWEQAHTGDEVLTRVVSDLRAALGDDPREPTYVETVPKVGYRLIADVGELDDAAHDLGETNGVGGAVESKGEREAESARPHRSALVLRVAAVAVSSIALTLLALGLGGAPTRLLRRQHRSRLRLVAGRRMAGLLGSTER